ncbi:MAG: group 1 glycosyl transferase [Candidatus Peregrinibacteria bacterium GW2011_GWE2_39_6]|nr:MAG: group 1 glycosyl transferase [Candidatus Peregrinibacteria bacterium GW2011_GWE2_39_6]
MGITYLGIMDAKLSLESSSEKQKTIIHLVYVLDRGGTEKMLSRLLPHLKKDYQNVVIGMKGDGPIGQELQKKEISVFYLDHGKIWHSPRTYWRFRKLIKQYKPAILSTYLPIPDIFGRIAGTNNHGVYAKVVLIDYLTSFLVDQYTINSVAISDYYCARYPFKKSRFRVIANFMNLDSFEKKYEPLVIKKQLTIPDNHLVIGYVANFHPYKGHIYLLKAFEEAYRYHKNISLIFIGDGSQKEALKKEIKQYQSQKQIYFCDFCENIPEMLSVMDIFAMPSFFEGQSNALLEAMASGLAIIASDIPENRILIEHEGNGLLVPVKNNIYLAKALKRLIENPKLREKLGKSAKLKIQQEFKPQKILDQYHEIYRK